MADEIELVHLFVEEDGRDVNIWSLNGIVQAYNTNTTEGFARMKAEEAGLIWDQRLSDEEE